MSHQSNKAKAFVHPYGPEDESKDHKIAKAIDDYMNNETEVVVLPEEEREPQSLEEALMS
tara:strand:- start:325 stop:504 length:180 start_codon:yes stop_codon:yes gene_type:complete